MILRVPKYISSGSRGSITKIADSSDLIRRFQKIKPQLFCLGFACCWNAAKDRFEIWSQRKDGSRHGGLTDDAGERQRVKSFRRQIDVYYIAEM